VKPESAAFLAKAQAFLAKARGMANQWPDEGRAGGIFRWIACGTRVHFREHRGDYQKPSSCAGEFGRLTKDDRRFAGELHGFLCRAFNLKVLADYETGPDSEVSA
jgi:hypothetical protein